MHGTARHLVVGFGVRRLRRQHERQLSRMHSLPARRLLPGAHVVAYYSTDVPLLSPRRNNPAMQETLVDDDVDGDGCIDAGNG